MRDVTDNVTGELDVEVKRGRGRPRKQGALTNAQRQAAFRARRRTEAAKVFAREDVTKTVTEKTVQVVSQVDAYDECRLEVDALRAELAEAHECIEGLDICLEDVRKKLFQAEIERDAVIGWGVSRDEAKLQAALKDAKEKSVTRNENTVPSELEEFKRMYKAACETNASMQRELTDWRFSVDDLLSKNKLAEREIERLCAELSAAKKGAGKTATRNENTVSSDLWLEAIALALKGRKSAARMAFASDLLHRLTYQLQCFDRPAFNRLQDICFGDRGLRYDLGTGKLVNAEQIVTAKRVTKKVA